MSSFAALSSRLEKAGQSHLLRFWADLTAEQQQELAAQLDALDFSELKKLTKEYVLRKPVVALPEDLDAAPFFPLHPRDPAMLERYAAAELRGAELLREGRVCCLTVAGGQGSRLGFEAPKGTYPIGPVSGKSLFQYFAESIRRTGEKYSTRLTWYIMTSLLNREATEDFFREHAFFGLEPEQVVFFSQGTMPAIGYDGKLLLTAPDSLSLSPDGHGGTLLALRKAGCLDRMKSEGVEYISYFQVDNPLVPVASPRFIGMHALENAQMSAIMLAKTGPYEKLGNFCVADGRVQIIEYSDLPAELAESVNADGSLHFIAGSPAIHMLSRSFVESLTIGGSLKLPWHRADKKVPFLDAAGQLVTPEEPNAVKLESFIFDAMPLAERTMVLEGDRSKVFAPTKNKTGVDSVESCREMLLARDAEWLRAAGVELPAGARVEISPLVAVDAADVAALVARGGVPEILPDAGIVLHG